MPLTEIISASIAAASLGVKAFMSRTRAKERLAASAIADETERLMQQNLAAWEASSKSDADKAQALANFDALWNKFVSDLSLLGKPGSQGITDRAREPQLGDKLPGVDWFKLYRDPIAEYESRELSPAGIPIVPIVLVSIGLLTLAYE